MTDEEKMTIEERYRYLRKVQKRYKEAKREEKSGLLTEMEAVTGRHRKSLARDMAGELKRKKRRGKRKAKYGNEVAGLIKMSKPPAMPGRHAQFDISGNM
jgi:hypothetical protein